MIVLTACSSSPPSPVYTVSISQSSLSNFIGETVPLQVSYSVTNGNITSPQLTSSCESIEIVSQSFDKANSGTIVAILRIVNYRQNSNCLTFTSNEHQEKLNVIITPQQQAKINNIDIQTLLNYDKAYKFTANVDIVKNEASDKYTLSLKSDTPNLKFMKRESDTSIDINQGVIEFTTGEYQNTANPYGYIILPNPKFPSVDFQPIIFVLYIGKNGKLYPIDAKQVVGLKATNINQ